LVDDTYELITLKRQQKMPKEVFSPSFLDVMHDTIKELSNQLPAQDDLYLGYRGVIWDYCCLTFTGVFKGLYRGAKSRAVFMLFQDKRGVMRIVMARYVLYKAASFNFKMDTTYQIEWIGKVSYYPGHVEVFDIKEL
jgi:hypothetical protein